MKIKCLPFMLALLCALTLFGCGRRQPDNAATPVTSGFSAQAAIRYHELQLQATVARGADGKLALTFHLPKTLSGVTLGWNGQDMTMELGGMSVKVPTEQVPQGALIQRLLQVLTADHSGGAVTDEGYVLQGEIEGEAYTLVCHPDTGLPVSLSLPAEELEVIFSESKTI